MADLMPGGRSVGRVFRRFHGRVVEMVGRLESGSWPDDGPLELEPVRAPILEEIARIGQQLGEEPAADPAVARQILYLLAVYADDRALAAAWPGAAAWGRQRLETELFGTGLGAAEVEARCERLLTVPTPENRQLARLFLYAFGLGLGGGADVDRERLSGLRRRLLDFARPARQPAVAGRRRLFRQAYRYTAARGERRLLPDLRGWLVLAAALLAVFALLSTVVWEGAVEGVGEALSSPRGAVPSPEAGAPAEPTPMPGSGEPVAPGPSSPDGDGATGTGTAEVDA